MSIIPASWAVMPDHIRKATRGVQLRTRNIQKKKEP
jgi:hypothetical protein